MNGNPSKEAFERALARMGDKLVELGYATRVVREDSAEAITIFWTPLGQTLQRELSRMFPEVRHGKATINLLDCQTLLALFLRTNSGIERGDGYHG